MSSRTSRAHQDTCGMWWHKAQCNSAWTNYKSFCCPKPLQQWQIHEEEAFSHFHNDKKGTRNVLGTFLKHLMTFPDRNNAMHVQQLILQTIHSVLARYWEQLYLLPVVSRQQVSQLSSMLLLYALGDEVVHKKFKGFDMMSRIGVFERASNTIVPMYNEQLWIITSCIVCVSSLPSTGIITSKLQSRKYNNAFTVKEGLTFSALT